MYRLISTLVAAAVLGVPWAGEASDPPVVFEFGPSAPTGEGYAEIHGETRDLALAALADVHGWFVGTGREFERAVAVEDTEWMACVDSPLAGLDALMEQVIAAERDLREALHGGDDVDVHHQITLLTIAVGRAEELADEATACEAWAESGGQGGASGPGEPVFGLHERPWYVHQPLAASGLEIHGAGAAIQDPSSAAVVSIGPHARFAPGLALSTVVDSNVTSSTTQPRRDLRFQLLPHVRLTVDSPAVVLGVEGEYVLDKLAGIGGSAPGQEDDGGSGLDRLSDGHAGLDLVAAPHAPISLVLGDHLVQRTEVGVGEAAADLGRLGALTNRARIGARIHPTSALTVSGLFRLDLGRHSMARIVDDQALPAELHSAYLDVSGAASLTWRFIPHTQLRAEADVGRVGWAEDALVQHRDTNHWRIRGGVEGDLSRTVGLCILVGASTVTATAEETGDRDRWSDLVGDVWLTWRPHPTQQVSAGYLRDTRPVHLGDSLLGSAAALRYEGMIAGQLLPAAEVIYHRHQIRGVNPRDDHELQARVALTLAPDDRFRVAVHYDLRALIATQHGGPYTDHRVGVTLELGAPGANLPWLPTLPRSL